MRVTVWLLERQETKRVGSQGSAVTISRGHGPRWRGDAKAEEVVPADCRWREHQKPNRQDMSKGKGL